MMEKITINDTEYEVLKELKDGVKVLRDKNGYMRLCNRDMECSYSFNDSYEITEFGFILRRKYGDMCLCNKDMEGSDWFNDSYEELKEGVYLLKYKDGYMCLCTKNMRCSKRFNGGYKFLPNGDIEYWNKDKRIFMVA